MLKSWLTRKITRQKLGEFLQQQATQAYTLEIGSSKNTPLQLFPNLVKSDIRFLDVLDAQFDTHHIPFSDNSFEVVLCLEVLEHCYNPQQAINEFYRVLKPNGKLILTTRFIFPLHDVPHDYFRFTLYGLQYLCRNFASVQISEEAGTIETMGVLYQRLGFQTEWYVPFFRIMFFLLAKPMRLLQKLLKQEYGDIQHNTQQRGILSSGYYVVAVKGQADG